MGVPEDKLAVVGDHPDLFYVICGVFPEFFSPYLVNTQSDFWNHGHSRSFSRTPKARFSLRPAVYGLEVNIDPIARTRTWTVDKTQIYPLSFFVKAEPLQSARAYPQPDSPVWCQH